jgi:hypothetical protein
MEHFLERRVVKEKTQEDNGIILLTVVATVLLSAGVLFVKHVNTYFPVVYLVLWYLAYRVILSRSVEYEYVFVDNALTIDRITGKKWRKRVFNASLNDFDVFSFLKPKDSGTFLQEARLEIPKGVFGRPDGLMYGVIHYDEKKTVVYFPIDETVMEYVRKHTDYKVKE